MKDDAKRYGKFVLIAAGLLCVCSYFVFLVGTLLSVVDQPGGDRGLLALMLLWMTPLTLAGDWYLTLPAILVTAAVLMYGWGVLPARITSWRPAGFWQNAVAFPFLAYGMVSSAVLLILLVVSIPASCASGPPG
ncbi:MULTISPECIES: hypothetical protein [Mycobacteroides]|jgi:hypothetical protein|uniref:hypothetical protein n=1 Tax=Mycobacteroides TaxID=670516 RepID=UPI00026868E5|nr:MULTISPECIES: hypothetical protein [Mycobacteroides]MDM2174187.1 hypothetical protein [Mycobacteroides abscessus]EIV62069.1 putative membrane protein [Mycobacteroides abscessus 3A-0930-R]EIV84564.1 putative membrane protein [Mycobacteroides abscessus 3A-0810-R]MBV0920668.1 hypothetical protein [Mycobacteroides chelonae]MDB2211795.1 hypothetical protein [Mycobacteroides abscessus subsp. massiliense]